MKKSIVLYFTLFISVFLFQWFFSELYDIFTPFLLISIYPVIFIIVIVMMIGSIYLFIKRHKEFQWKAAVPLITIVLLIAVSLFFPFEKAKVLTEFILYTPQREKVVKMIDSEPTSENKMWGTVILPIRYRHLSCDGTVYVEKHTEDALVIGFWVFRGLSVNGSSMVYYTSTQDETTLQYLIEDDISTLIKLNANWYYVVTD